MGSWSEEEILAGMRDPERRSRAFRELHLRFGPRLLGLLVKMCRGDRETAEDLLGRALYKAYLALARMEEPCRSLPAWLYTVAARTALDEFDRRASEEPLRLTSLDIGPEPAAPCGAADERPEGQGEVDRAIEAVLERLDQEDPRYRTLLEMEHVGACDRGEIAEATGIARKQLSQYLKRARERFVRIAREYPALASFGEPAGENGEESP
jgi:RNA polymerase sigma factor (sigma-70 family)